jgi:predicted AAA+ superfamily ATPase
LFGLIDSGGFPATFDFPKPQQLFQQYFVDIIAKNIREHVAARSSRAIQAVVKMVFESIGSEISLRRITGSAQLSPETVNHYLQACEDAYLIFSCPFFAYSENQRQRHNREYYSIDTSLCRSIVTQRTTDYGKDFENPVYLGLRAKTKDIAYWRGGLCSPDGSRDHTNTSHSGCPQVRHKDALAEFHRKFSHATEALFVTPDSFEQIAAR